MFTTEVREELAHLPLTDVGDEAARRAEIGAMLRLGGALRLRGAPEADRRTIVVSTSSGAVARRLRTNLLAVGTARPELEVHPPQGLRRGTTYRVRLTAGIAQLACCGALDAQGRPVAVVPVSLTATRATRASYLRGALMVAGSLSDPRRAVHVEIAAESQEAAGHLVGLLTDAGAPGAKAVTHGQRWRAVVKSGDQVGAVLVHVGAHGAFLRWDEGRLRRELRGAANRAANADQANVARAVGASSRQTRAIQRLVTERGWDALPDELARMALARLANPEASLGQLGSLLDPVVGKATVHRRLARLEAMAGGLDPSRGPRCPGQG